MVNDRNKELELLSERIKKCQDCNLCKTANNAVPGEGPGNAEIMFIGEGPGFNEDKLGRPFVGLAGQLLDKLLIEINIKRDEVFIANVVKHRPPENRDPMPEEITACSKWLDKQIEIINPKIIVTLGRFSMSKFINGALISRVHGQPRNVGERIIIPMFHPAAALRDPKVLEITKSDFQKIIKYQKNNTNIAAQTNFELVPTGDNAKNNKTEEQLSLI